jgi:hypothetical protein
MAKNQMTKGGAGGGPGSRAMHAPTTYFTGRPSTRISPKGVSQIGSSMGNKAMDNGGKVLRGAVEPVKLGAMGGMGSVPLGSEVQTDRCLKKNIAAPVPKLVSLRGSKGPTITRPPITTT